MGNDTNTFYGGRLVVLAAIAATVSVVLLFAYGILDATEILIPLVGIFILAVYALTKVPENPNEKPIFGLKFEVYSWRFCPLYLMLGLYGLADIDGSGQYKMTGFAFAAMGIMLLCQRIDEISRSVSQMKQE